MNGLVFLLNMVQGYGIDDTIQRVTFVYILMSIFMFYSFHSLNDRLLQQPLIISTLL